MALVKYGLIITEIKGKLNGQVLQGGNNSKILRGNSNKKNSKSNALNQSTSLLVQVTSQFKLLTPGEHASWVVAAASWPFIDKFGNTYYGNAFQCFTAYNRNLLTIGGTIVGNANAVTPSVNVGPFSFTSSTIADVTITPTTVLATDQYYLVYASPGYSKGRNMNNPSLKFLGAINMNGAAELKITSYYNAVFGDFIKTSKVIFKITQVNPDYPFAYFPVTISSVIS